MVTVKVKTTWKDDPVDRATLGYAHKPLPELLPGDEKMSYPRTIIPAVTYERFLKYQDKGLL